MHQQRVYRGTWILLLAIALFSTADRTYADVQSLVCSNCLNWCMTGFNNGGSRSNYEECTLGCTTVESSCVAPTVTSITEYFPPAPIITEPVMPEIPSPENPYTNMPYPEPEVCPGGSGQNGRCFSPGMSPEVQKLVNERDLALADQKRYENEKKDLQFRLMLAYNQGDKKEIRETERLLKKADKNMLKAEAEVAKIERKLASMGVFIPPQATVVSN